MHPIIAQSVEPTERQIRAAEVVAEKVAEVMQTTSKTNPADTLVVLLVVVGMVVGVVLVRLVLHHLATSAERTERVTKTYLDAERVGRAECHAHGERMAEAISHVANDLKTVRDDFRGVHDDWRRGIDEVREALRKTSH